MIYTTLVRLISLGMQQEANLSAVSFMLCVKPTSQHKQFPFPVWRN